MKLIKRTAKQKARRGFRVQNRVRSSGRLRLSVFRSNKHIYAQIIDDVAGTTLVSASTVEKTVLSTGFGSDCDAAAAVGKALAERAVQKGISEIAFDRGSYRYHGRLAALANAAREAGLSF
ncbi:MAG: 50S ribosomal protein L18 [Planctomyces sp.]|nr:50S ribosomal protein L18 [Planctomyces sp.]